MEGTKTVHYDIRATRVLDKIYTNTFYIGDSRKTSQGLEEVAAMLQASPDDRDMLLDNIRQATTHVTATLSRLIGRTRCSEEVVPDTDDDMFAGTLDSLADAQTKRPEGAWATVARPFTLTEKYSQSGTAIDLVAGDVIVATGYYDPVQVMPQPVAEAASETGSQIPGGALNPGTSYLGGTVWQPFPDHPRTGQFEFTILATRNMPTESFKEIAALSEDLIAAFATREWALSVKPDEATTFANRLAELENRLRVLGSIRQKPLRKSLYGGLRQQDVVIEEE